MTDGLFGLSSPFCFFPRLYLQCRQEWGPWWTLGKGKEGTGAGAEPDPSRCRLSVGHELMVGPPGIWSGCTLRTHRQDRLALPSPPPLPSGNKATYFIFAKFVLRVTSKAYNGKAISHVNQRRPEMKTLLFFLCLFTLLPPPNYTT